MGVVGGEKQSIWLKKMMILNRHNSLPQSTAARALLQHFDVWFAISLPVICSSSSLEGPVHLVHLPISVYTMPVSVCLCSGLPLNHTLSHPHAQLLRYFSSGKRNFKVDESPCMAQSLQETNTSCQLCNWWWFWKLTEKNYHFHTCLPNHRSSSPLFSYMPPS